MATIALMTDYGMTDGFVGMMKGTILNIAPETTIIDMTHKLESFNIKAAAFMLQKSVTFYPSGTIFLAVVDPGVGTERRILAAKAGDYKFVVPDNGLLSYALSDFDDKEIVSVENSRYFLSTGASTFHGRDIMAPVAAHMANGVALGEFGTKVDSYAFLKMPNLLKHNNSVIGEIVYVDKFGNMISNIKASDLRDFENLSHCSCTVADVKGIRFVSSYASGEGLSAIISGYGTVEIFVNQGSAASRFQQPVGTTIAIEG
jgi:hypothetical protein